MIHQVGSGKTRVCSDDSIVARTIREFEFKCRKPSDAAKPQNSGSDLEEDLLFFENSGFSIGNPVFAAFRRPFYRRFNLGSFY